MSAQKSDAAGIACRLLIRALEALGSEPQFSKPTSEILKAIGDLRALERERSQR